MRFSLLCLLTGISSLAHGQSATVQNVPAHFYAGLEGNIFASKPTQLTNSSAHLAAGESFREPRPALLVGYQLRPRLSLEAGLQPLPVVTGFAYARESSTAYLGFSSNYVNDYLYLPLRAVGQVLGTGHRLRLSVLAGGGPAWTNLTAGLPISPNGTTSVAVTNADGSVSTASYTEQITREQSAFAVLEAGLRGSYWFASRLAADLNVRQLWGLSASARDMTLEINTPNEYLATKLTTPVRGLSIGLGVRYAFR
jgi:hypothetical protein